ncbi:MAG: DnaD domain protein [Chloroflexi bacterium]|nr:DnaD domain protein [Chloroflexota bacterium]
MVAPGAQVVRTAHAEPPTRAAEAYEQEIGPLGPAVADGIARAEERYPEAWIVEAVRLAATRNARSWRYVEAVLARWEAEGRDDATAGGAAARARGGRAYDHGPYEHAVRRS